MKSSPAGMYFLTGVAVLFLYGDGCGDRGGSTLSSHWAYVWSEPGGSVALSNIPLMENGFKFDSYFGTTKRKEIYIHGLVTTCTAKSLFRILYGPNYY